MNLRLATCFVFLLGFAGSLLGADAFVGTWKLNLAKSKHLPDDQSAPWPKERTLTVEERGDTFLFTDAVVTHDGRAQKDVFNAPQKSGPVTFTEGYTVPAGQAWSIRKINEHALDLITKDRETSRTAHLVVSADGRTLTVETKGGSTNPQRQGKRIDRVEVYNRQ